MFSARYKTLKCKRSELYVDWWYRRNCEPLNYTYDTYIKYYNISFDDWVYYCYNHTYY